MKFFYGIITGVLATIIGYYVYATYIKTDDGLVGYTELKQKGDCITKQKLKIFQTLKPDMALAKFGVFPNDIMVMVVNYNGIVYYDDQKIIIPKNQCARQIGTYQYETKLGILKTVPVVVIE